VNAVQHILRSGVRFYQWVLSPAQAVLFGPLGRCRFEPSCSAYALEAIEVHGGLNGSWLAAKRICRCHPWGGCGHDAVPGRQYRNAKLESEEFRFSSPAVSGAGIGNQFRLGMKTIRKPAEREAGQEIHRQTKALRECANLK
jgi:putative membrane protein insertion efficiency factor